MTNILLVEDDRAIIENLSAVLKAEGFQVRAEAGQREALEAIQEEKFDLLQQTSIGEALEAIQEEKFNLLKQTSIGEAKT